MGICEKIKIKIQQHPILAGILSMLASILILNEYWSLFSDKPMIPTIYQWGKENPTIKKMIKEMFSMQTIYSVINLFEGVTPYGIAFVVVQSISASMIVYIVYLTRKPKVISIPEVKNGNRTPPIEIQSDLKHNQIEPKFEINVDKEIFIKWTSYVVGDEDELVSSAPMLELNIFFLPNKPMIFSKLFLEIDDTVKIEPSSNSVYEKPLHLPFSINQAENYNLKFILPGQFDKKGFVGKVIAVANGIEWESDKFGIDRNSENGPPEVQLEKLEQINVDIIVVINRAYPHAIPFHFLRREIDKLGYDDSSFKHALHALCQRKIIYEGVKKKRHYVLQDLDYFAKLKETEEYKNSKAHLVSPWQRNADEEVKTETTRPEHFDQVLKVISKYNRILKVDLYKMPHNKNLTKQYTKESNEDFTSILDIPEVANNEELFKEIGNAKNRAETVLWMAKNVSFDSDELDKAYKFGVSEAMSIQEYNEQTKAIIDQFVEHKELIFKLCGFNY